MDPAASSSPDFAALASHIKQWGRELGFQHVGIADTDLADAEAHLLNWLKQERHGEMAYMATHGVRRSRPHDLVAGTARVISVRLNYLPPAAGAEAVLENPLLGYVSRYALGRDYHKVVRNRLQKLADRIQREIGPFGYRVFSDSAPVLEKALAQKAGLGWIGKHTNLLSRDAGSWFFLGEIYTDLPLPTDVPADEHCGTCRSCIDICPTQAIVGPYELDARRCIAYLTIELKGSIPQELRPLIGNRVYGCDDCQLVCPWNRFAQMTGEADFTPRHGLDAPTLAELFGWSEDEFLKRTEGSAIRRIGYEQWLRNIAVGLGNAPTCDDVVQALRSRHDDPSELVREHVHWALARHVVQQ
jgi:epoxyqueuosine reductase